jgi:hypothetical protein
VAPDWDVQTLLTPQTLDLVQFSRRRLFSGI